MDNQKLSGPQQPSFLTSTTNTITTFVALYITTLFSMDTWAAARGSPYRAPGANAYNRPANTPTAGSYQDGMYNGSRRGNGGSGGSGHGDVGRVPAVRDSRPPMRMGGAAACGACMI